MLQPCLSATPCTDEFLSLCKCAWPWWKERASSFLPACIWSDLAANVNIATPLFSSKDHVASLFLGFLSSLSNSQVNTPWHIHLKIPPSLIFLLPDLCLALVHLLSIHNGCPWTLWLLSLWGEVPFSPFSLLLLQSPLQFALHAPTSSYLSFTSDGWGGQTKMEVNSPTLQRGNCSLAQRLEHTLPDSWSNTLAAILLYSPRAVCSCPTHWTQPRLTQLHSHPVKYKGGTHPALTLPEPSMCHWLRQLHLLKHQCQVPCREGKVAEKAILCSVLGLKPDFAKRLFNQLNLSKPPFLFCKTDVKMPTLKEQWDHTEN